jgi:ABC-2 type transport system permease protein
MKSIRRYLKIYAILFRQQAMVSTMYRFGFMIEILVEFLYALTRIIFVGALYFNTKSISGWSLYQMLFLMGVNTISSELILGAVTILNLRELGETIKNGTLDLILTKPVNSLFMLSLSKPYFTSIIACIPGVFLMIYSMAQMDQKISIPSIICGILIFMAGMVIAYSFFIIITSFNFVFINATTLIKIAETVILNYKINPQDVYTGALKLVFWLVIPVVFMSSVPAKVMFGRVRLDWLGMSWALAIVFLFIAMKIWGVMQKKYTSAGG